MNGFSLVGNEGFLALPRSSIFGFGSMFSHPSSIKKALRKMRKAFGGK